MELIKKHINITFSVANLYIVVIYFIAPILQFTLIGSGYFLTLEELSKNLFIITIYILTFIIIYIYSYYSTLIKTDNKRLPTFNSVYRLVFVIIISLPIIFYYIHNGLILSEEDLNIKRSTGAKSETIINFFIGIVLPNLYGIYLISTNKLNKYRSIVFILISSLSLFSGYRGVFISNMLFYLIIRYKINNIFFDKKAKYYLLLFIILIAVLGSLRNSKNIELISILQASIVRVSGIELISIMNNYTISNGYDYFYHNIIDTISIIIPRILYTSKPLSLSEIISTNVYSYYLNLLGIFQDDYGGVAYTLIGEAIWNMGFIGIILYAIFYGFIIAKSNFYLNSDNWTKFLLGKAIFVNVLLLIESPQLGINAIILNFVISILILKYYKI